MPKEYFDFDQSVSCYILLEVTTGRYINTKETEIQDRNYQCPSLFLI